jgi:hypothetical protein
MHMPGVLQASVIFVPGQSIARDVVPGGDHVVLAPEGYKRGYSAFFTVYYFDNS